MIYSISNIQLIDAFGKNSECPFCILKKEVENSLVKMLLTEGVTDEETRLESNASGFCKRHLHLMEAAENKLGFALQLNTRMIYLKNLLSSVKNTKTALKTAEKIKKELSTCIICKYTYESMERYYSLTAKTYGENSEFRALFNNSKGFCLEHYEGLLRNVKSAKSHAEAYIKELSALENENLSRLIKELDWFCDKFDYRNSDKPWGNSKDAPERTVKKYIGD